MLLVMKLIVRWFLLAAALLLVPQVYAGVTVSGYSAALVAALVLGLFNTLVRPLLVLLTLPVTLLTLGLFLFVINALMFWAAASVLGEGFNVAGFGAQRFAEVADPGLRRLCVTLYNDAMLEIQETSNGRLLPMALMPWWDVEASIQEVHRTAADGLRGVNICTGAA